MRSTSSLSAVRDPRFLIGWWPWRVLAYLVTGGLLGAAVLLMLATLLTLGVVGTPVLVGIPLLAAWMLAGIPLGALERRRLRLVDDRPIASPHRLPPVPGLVSWLRTRFTEAATWRALIYAVLLGAVLWPYDLLLVTMGVLVPVTFVCAPLMQALVADGEIRLAKVWLVDSPAEAWLAVPAGIAALAASCYLLTVYCALRAKFARVLLTHTDRSKRDEVGAIASSRARLVDGFEAERRRIERDLHDGAQQRLMALGVMLGLATVSTGREQAELVDRAHRQAKEALSELRELVRGIYPRILTDRGLDAALREAADRSTVPVDVHCEMLPRLPPGVESAAYFAVCEALANIDRHSGATRAHIEALFDRKGVTIAVEDDGRGGADPADGSGLQGLADRLAVVDGTMVLCSPPGGPTVIRMQIPCRPSPR